MIYPATDITIQQAAEALKQGSVVAFPTETVYGLGANAFDTLAVASIFAIKERPYFDPLIVHVNSLSMVSMVAATIPPVAMQCMEKFWPGPLTIVLPKKDDIPDIVTAGLATVAIRMPLHPVALRLIELADVPVAAPSANPFGYLSPTTAQHVAMQLGTKVAMILDGGKCAVGVESTIIKIENDEVSVLRYGGIPVEEIEKATGLAATSHTTKIEAPGQLPYHYAPQTKIVLVSDIMSVPDDATCGLLLFKKRHIPHTHIHIMCLSDDGDMRQAAGNLFSCLHTLDALKLKVIYAEQVEEVGLGRAIMDRLKKAQARFM